MNANTSGTNTEYHSVTVVSDSLSTEAPPILQAALTRLINGVTRPTTTAARTNTDDTASLASFQARRTDTDSSNLSVATVDQRAMLSYMQSNRQALSPQTSCE
eukprot:TRINITY_DN80653_c0_g1_i1.p1 TRINITY_DN80653_c0_g1~~TRINITY_DN80653_c0_g1_i1.p1  ORF type:complete len:103 (+),score=3.61 TRINITY_DN80653_c0_g1_i1:45-353(+)